MSQTFTSFLELPTSIWAYDDMKPQMPELERRIVELLQHEPTGLTADELATRLKRSVLAIRPIVSIMKLHRGFLIATGETRLNESGKHANVWRLRCAQ